MGFLDFIGVSFSERPKTVDNFDVDRFMVDHRVLYATLTPKDKNAHNPMECYTKDVSGTIHLTYKFNEESFDGPEKVMRGKAWPTDISSFWKLQFVWPFKADYLVTYQSDDKNLTVVTVPSKDYVWLMSKNGYEKELEVKKALNWLTVNGYPMDDVKKLPRNDMVYI
ncbi:hypothetical protein SARC_13599 [Sphaeroforma arctica JP610]|uniref:Lipocalin/cytosolic fatty-acid binding domain-containing protein n=1 Tax=Sphaeroforma arctica JP610 TaxID=667725 RepID=A0A0L0FCQ0_9EUKA|nr:hypothetical protein SARC_13599 [Sphaeroforma arctica JP610]KNC73843.1 hypothetical protein SARC_13599 [Sphaeroforma arctica JP610]|eukprot:XP_014147745.1 hypothetical protein SARC_13599 [Sphaeroforma arctica JP610]